MAVYRSCPQWEAMVMVVAVDLVYLLEEAGIPAALGHQGVV